MDNNVSDDELYDEDDDVKKVEVKVETDDDEDDDDDEDEEESSGSNSELKSRLVKIMIFIVIGMVVFLLILFIISLFTGRKKYSYESVEDVMTKAAISYFKDNPSYLPANDGGIVEVDVANLVAAGKMKDLSSYLDDGSSCSGSVLVENSSNDYSYRPYLNCGESYSTVEFAKKIINDNKIVTSGYGLYHVGNEYVFRGEEINNYVSLETVNSDSSSLWRIVKITSNDEVVLIRKDSLISLVPWDNRYNDESRFTSGFNNYGSSRIRERLQKFYENLDNEFDREALSSVVKKKLTSFDLCIGKRDINSVGIDNEFECSEVLENQKMGLLTLSEYMSASIDPSCKSGSSRSCVNYNFLASANTDWWLITADNSTSYSVYSVGSGGGIVSEKAVIYKGVRPVIHLSKNNVAKSGKGTLNDPYILK